MVFCLGNMFFKVKKEKKKKEEKKVIGAKSSHTPPHALPHLDRNAVSFWTSPWLQNFHLLTPPHAPF